MLRGCDWNVKQYISAAIVDMSFVAAARSPLGPHKALQSRHRNDKTPTYAVAMPLSAAVMQCHEAGLNVDLGVASRFVLGQDHADFLHLLSVLLEGVGLARGLPSAQQNGWTECLFEGLNAREYACAVDNSSEVLGHRLAIPKAKHRDAMLVKAFALSDSVLLWHEPC